MRYAKTIGVMVSGMGLLVVLGCGKTVSQSEQKDIFAPQVSGDVAQPTPSDAGTATEGNASQQQPAATSPSTEQPQAPTDAAAQKDTSAPVTTELAPSSIPTAPATTQTPPPVSEEEMDKIAKDAKECVDGGGVYNTFAQKCFKN